jgi:hypothetical protein
MLDRSLGDNPRPSVVFGGTAAKPSRHSQLRGSEYANFHYIDTFAAEAARRAAPRKEDAVEKSCAG